MLEGRFEPAGGGLRLVWWFWACGGVAGGRERCLIGLRGLRRAQRAPRPRASDARPTLQLGCCSRIELAHARIAPFFRPATAHNPSTARERKSGTRGSYCAVLFHNLGRATASLRNPLLLGPKVPFSHGCAFCFYSHTAGRPGAVLSRESRSLAAPSGARARARRSQTTTDREKAASPLQGVLHGALALARKQRLALARPRNCGTGFSCNLCRSPSVNPAKFPRVRERTGGLFARFASAWLLCLDCSTLQ